jgi:nicotinamide riboside kinase
MDIKLKIALSGVQGTGKTTLLQAIESDPFFVDWTIIPGITRLVKAQGFDINDQGDDNTQLFMTAFSMFNFFSNTQFNSISDRCLLDIYAYTTDLFIKNKVKFDTLEFVEKAWQSMVGKYDIIYYIPPEFDLVADGHRNIDPSYREDIQKIMEKIIKDTPDSPIHRLTGTVEERLNKIKTSIQNYVLMNGGDLP